ncbi:hypothetical protein CYMTET_23327, partial [Cymbomonas tetramitiformis]
YKGRKPFPAESLAGIGNLVNLEMKENAMFYNAHGRGEAFTSPVATILNPHLDKQVEEYMGYPLIEPSAEGVNAVKRALEAQVQSPNLTTRSASSQHSKAGVRGSAEFGLGANSPAFDVSPHAPPRRQPVDRNDDLPKLAGAVAADRTSHNDDHAVVTEHMIQVEGDDAAAVNEQIIQAEGDAAAAVTEHMIQAAGDANTVSDADRVGHTGIAMTHASDRVSQRRGLIHHGAAIPAERQSSAIADPGIIHQQNFKGSDVEGDEDSAVDVGGALLPTALHGVPCPCECLASKSSELRPSPVLSQEDVVKYLISERKRSGMHNFDRLMDQLKKKVEAYEVETDVARVLL